MKIKVPKGWKADLLAPLTVLALWLLCRRELIRAQTVNGSFHGIISDSTEAVIPDATVVVRHENTGAIRQTTSKGAGFYTLTQFRSTQGFTEFANVPYASELAGNFSDLLTTTQATSNGIPVVGPLGRPVYVGQIYNPYGTRQVNAGAVDPTTGLVAQSTGLVRDPLPGNILPNSMVNPTALLWILSLWPTAN
jgi:hypothetical protein